MRLRVIVIDTSYLLEIFQVPGYSDHTQFIEIGSRHKEAITLVQRDMCRLYIPFPVVYEVANHIVDVRDGTRRQSLADSFVGLLVDSMNLAKPWIITPASGKEAHMDIGDLMIQCQRYRQTYAVQDIGLTDSALIHEAIRLKQKYQNHASVHIWTTDRRLKSFEPDTEPNPFPS